MQFLMHERLHFGSMFWRTAIGIFCFYTFKVFYQFNFEQQPFDFITVQFKICKKVIIFTILEQVWNAERRNVKDDSSSFLGGGGMNYLVTCSYLIP